MGRRRKGNAQKLPGAPMPEFLPELFWSDVLDWMDKTGMSLDSLAHFTGYGRRTIETWGDGTVKDPPGRGLRSVGWVLGVDDMTRWWRMPKRRPS